MGSESRRGGTLEDLYLVICDLDGTLLGNEQHLREFVLWHERQQDRVRLVYNTGRLLRSVRELIEAGILPRPEAVIGGVGTQLQVFLPPELRGRSLDQKGSSPAWLDDCAGWQPVRIMFVLSQYTEVTLQPAEFLSEHKISFYACDLAPEMIKEIRDRLRASGCRVELVYSSNRDLDVLPRGVDKGSAAARLASMWSIPAERVIVCGDTGNDLSMFRQGFLGIVVGNAHPELRSLDSWQVFHADLPYAAGVLQGLSYWFSKAAAGDMPPTGQLQ